MNIAEVRAAAVRLPMKHPFSYGNVKRTESTSVVIRLRSDDNVVGYGEVCLVPQISPESPESVVEVIDRVIRPALVKREVLDWTHTLGALPAGVRRSPLILAGVDTALIDLAAKSLGVHVTQLFGGPQRRSIAVHGSVGWSQDKEEMVELAARQVDRYPWLKVYIGRDNLGEDLDRLRAVRSAVGDAIELSVDINGLWTRANAFEALPVLKELGVAAVEQPIDPSDSAGQKLVADVYQQSAGIDVILDERISSVQSVHEASCLQLGHVVNVGVAKLGGLTVALNVARSASEHHLAVAVGSLTELGIATAAGLALAALTPGMGRVPAALNGPEHFIEYVTSPDLVATDGFLELPLDAPGFGYEISERISDLFDNGGER